MDTLPIWLRIALAILATWRITHLIVAEDGPWDIVVRLRRALGEGELARLMDCFYCASLWIAAPFAWLGGSDPLAWLVTWLAVSGGASLLERATAPGDRSASVQVLSEGDRDELLRRGPPAGDIPSDDPLVANRFGHTADGAAGPHGPTEVPGRNTHCADGSGVRPDLPHTHR